MLISSYTVEKGRVDWHSSLSGFNSSAFYISIWQIIISGKRTMAYIKSEKIQFQTSEEKAPSTYSFFWVSTRLITGTYCLSLRHHVPASSNSRRDCNFYVCLLLVCCLLAESCQEWVIFTRAWPSISIQTLRGSQIARPPFSFLFMTQISLIHPCSLPTWAVRFILDVIKKKTGKRLTPAAVGTEINNMENK